MAFTRLAQVVKNARDLNMVFVVIEVQEIRKPNFHAYDIIVGDSTGRRILSLLDERGSRIQEGDVLRMVDGKACMRNGEVSLIAYHETLLQRIGKFIGELGPDASDGLEAFIMFYLEAFRESQRGPSLTAAERALQENYLNRMADRETKLRDGVEEAVPAEDVAPSTSTASPSKSD